MFGSVVRFIKRWLPGRDEVRHPGRFARQSVAMLRREYQGKPLEEAHVDPDPILQFEAWFEEATRVIRDDPNAMVLSTVDERGRPSGRTVLLKGFSDDGFIFYTNYESRKGREIRENPHVALTFNWPELMRQVRIEGVAEKTTEEQSDAYFHSRPAGSRISAVASPQSRVVSSRRELEERTRNLEEKYRDFDEIPRPENWGGYLVRPELIEFWQGRVNRLHDRICYTREPEGGWQFRRLAP
jgi:pyridoxamine 5'-phosphate oxidase